jgi:hypothetical protein
MVRFILLYNSRIRMSTIATAALDPEMAALYR